MARILIYNPETEYALASNSPFYTPPRSVVGLRQMLAPKVLSLLARDCDLCLLLDPTPHLILADNIPLILNGMDSTSFAVDTASLPPGSIFEACPWGWNPQIARLLKDFSEANNIHISRIPSDDWIENLRKLANRITTIDFLRNLPEAFSAHIRLPEVIKEPSLLMKRYYEERALFIKAPWSSSGRGVVRTDDLEPKHVEPWARGKIRTQGSVLVEPVYDKVLDFATEWIKTSEDARFLGVSVFEASSRGKYHGQIEGSQQDLTKLIMSNTSQFTPHLISSQRDAIIKTLHGYEGPLGIDMMVLRDGTIHPCVEINLRLTMGMLSGEFRIEN